MVATQDLSIVMDNGMMSIYAPDNGDYWDAMHGIAGASWDEGNQCWVAPINPVTLEQVRYYMRRYFGQDDRDQADDLPVEDYII